MSTKFDFTKYTLNNPLLQEEEMTKEFPRAELDDAIYKAIKAGLTKQEILDIVRMATANMEGSAEGLDEGPKLTLDYTQAADGLDKFLPDGDPLRNEMEELIAKGDTARLANFLDQYVDRDLLPRGGTFVGLADTLINGGQ